MTQDLARWATWREIHAQPAIWKVWAGQLPVADLRAWVAGLGVDEVWFCGAGTSAYIGDMIVAGLEGMPGPRLRSVPTTDLVSRPHAYLNGRRPLVVSFGRSGNSTESIGTLDALDALAPDAPRLNIVCNADSALARRVSGPSQRVILLPDATHDAGFAMTSSFSTMLLTALAVFDQGDAAGRITTLSDLLADLLPSFGVYAASASIPERIVFVGAGPLAFAAREAALKVMELTAGRVPALWDSSLGFRHGPKSFVVGQTDIVVMTSSAEKVAAYDVDLTSELRVQFPLSRVTSVGRGGDVDVASPFSDVWNIPLAVAFAQVLAVVWSDRLGIPVDDPFAGQGTLSRVVSGVKLYPVDA